MKKILAFIICIVLVFAMPLVAFAEEVESAPVDEESSVTENVPTEEEEVTEEEFEGETATPEETPTPEPTPEPEPIPTPTPEPEPTPTPVPTPEQNVLTNTPTETPLNTPTTTPTTEVDVKVITEDIAAWLEANSGAIAIICTIIGNCVIVFNTIKKVVKSMTTMNNNAVSISEHSGKIANDALTKVGELSALVDEIRLGDKEKKELEKALKESQSLLNATLLANKAMAAEVAKLITLANLPNSVKDEMYADFLNNVRAVLDAANTEVKVDVAEEA